MADRTSLFFLFFGFASALSMSVSSADMNNHKPIVYTIAGSDSGGGAGIQADLHTIHAWGCHGCSAITCLTAQNSVTVQAVHTPPADFLRQQLDVLCQDLPPTAVKIGMLGNWELTTTVGAFLKELRQQNTNCWVVLDPVMISTSGHRLIEPDTQQTMVEQVFPFAHVLTPNKFEAEALLDNGKKLETFADVEQAARDILQMGQAEAILIKGGHSQSETNMAQDYFLTRSHDDGRASSTSSSPRPRLCDGKRGVWLRSPRYDTEHTHGTGCTLSSSIASALALGEAERQQLLEQHRGAFSAMDSVDACCLAKAYVTAGISRANQLGQGPGPVLHTSFPHQAEHFPVIVSDPTNTKDTPFRKMMAFSKAKAGQTTAEADVLGRTLPIVESADWVKRLCELEGVTDIQLRVKNESDPGIILRIVQQAQKYSSEANVRLWINDHWEAAVEADCFGIHLGQEDLCDCVQSGGLDKIRAKNMALGVSTHSFGELAAALGVQPSYISLGPVFGTVSKKVGFEPQGLEVVSRWRELIPPDIPFVCIGGISDTKATLQVRKAGADCAAVIGAVTNASDLQKAIRGLNAAMDTN